MNYKEYLQSEEWANKRIIVIEREWWRCKCCNSRKNLNVHHRTYETIHTDQEINDLTLLCWKCHTIIHKHTDIKRSAIHYKRNVVGKNKNKEVIKLYTKK